MPHITDQAVCIRHWDWSETSQTVSLFTREHGLIRGLAKGARREKGKFSGGIDLLARGQIVAIVKHQSGNHSPADAPMATLTEWTITDLYPALRTNLVANRAGLYMADLIHRMLTDSDPHAALYDAFIRALEHLQLPSQVESAVLEFQWALLRESGYQPQLDRDVQTNRPLPGKLASAVFVPVRGGFTIADDADRDASATGWRARGETIDLLRRLSAVDPDTALRDNKTTIAAESIRRASRLLAAYLREIIGSEPPTFRLMFPDLSR